MKRRLLFAVLLLFAMLTGFCYGYIVHRNKIFPYEALKRAFMHRIYNRTMNWSIGIYEGTTPFDLTNPYPYENPVLSARDVTDAKAAFVADPFMVIRDKDYFMFFEVLDMNTYKGKVGYAVSVDGKNWEYGKIVIEEEFHLSYPCVYQWEGVFYMIPESSEDNSVKLYKAISFPEEWEFVGDLLSGSPFFDPTLFYHDSKWWMFTSYPGNKDLDLFFSDSLFSGWQAHPMNPIVKNNNRIARPAGGVFEFEKKLFRLAQDAFPVYGTQVFAIEIAELTTKKYREYTDSAKLILKGTGKGWNKGGMHHLDLHLIDRKYVGVVDGVRRKTR